MSYEVLMSLAAFAFVSSITPGPNNLMLMASGANFGFRPTIPHMLGIGIGFAFMIVLLGAGLAQIFTLYPLAYDVLKVVSIVYLLYLAWKIATAASPHAERKSGAPLTFLQAALFQWVNPKAWTMALAAITVYSPTQSMTAIALVAVIFGVINIPCVSTWTVLGQQMQRLLTKPMRLRAFNMLMAALLVASLYPILFP